jgi:hypothetical protein
MPPKKNMNADIIKSFDCAEVQNRLKEVLNLDKVLRTTLRASIEPIIQTTIQAAIQTAL